jgi:methylase of polypeptide subunit release factors
VISINNICINDINIDETWNFADSKEMLMHTIHAYPAKFPAFIASKAFEYAKDEKVSVNTVADIFCGCGTVALESKMHNKEFWGCDINPVATLIAQVKSASYNIDKLNEYYEMILEQISNFHYCDEIYDNANERLKYWFTKDSYIELYKIKSAINILPNSKYRKAFLCIFSSILKSCSKWLTKSIKPQVDPKKKTLNVLHLFSLQYNKFIKSVEETANIRYDSKVVIKNNNFLTVRKLPSVDLLITSPPYVTSYEYADLHQLSSLWLNYTDDYRNLRKGSIGSTYNSDGFGICLDDLNNVGKEIVQSLIKRDRMCAKTRSVARYYLDMQHVIQRCSEMINPGGMAFFVVGDTEYKGVKIMNSEHLIQSLLDCGFSDIKIAKRNISNKLLTPYRDEMGKFSSDKSKRTIYHEELIISGRM